MSPQIHHGMVIGLEALAIAGEVFRPLIGAVVRDLLLDIGMVRFEVSREIEGLLQVRRRSGIEDLSLHRIIAAPARPFIDTDRMPAGGWEVKEAPCFHEGALDHALIDPVIRDVEKAGVARRLVDLPGDRRTLRGIGGKAVGQVDHRNVVRRLGRRVGYHRDPPVFSGRGMKLGLAFLAQSLPVRGPFLWAASTSAGISTKGGRNGPGST